MYPGPGVGGRSDEVFGGRKGFTEDGAAAFRSSRLEERGFTLARGSHFEVEFLRRWPTQTGGEDVAHFNVVDLLGGIVDVQLGKSG